MIKYLYISVIFLSSFSYASESEQSGEAISKWYEHHLLLTRNKKNRKNRRNDKQLNSISRSDKKDINSQLVAEENKFSNNPSRKKSINS